MNTKFTKENTEIIKKRLGIAEALQKGRKYCVYQERSQQEVRDKLYTMGLNKNEVEATIAELITENYINEERFAIAFAGGKFRIKQWGKVKIKMALQQKKISPYCIRKSMEQISDNDYNKILDKLIAEQASNIKEKNRLKKNYKMAQYIISKGFEPDLVWDKINGLTK